MGDFSINGQVIKNPTGFKVERYKITTLNRLASGMMSGDLIAKKKKFYFVYDAITSRELKDILAVIWDTDELFFDLIYPYEGSTQLCSVYVGSIPSDLARAGTSDDWVWKGVTFNLIER